MALEKVALEDSYFVERKLYPNVDFYSGIILKALGIISFFYTLPYNDNELLNSVASSFSISSDELREALKAIPINIPRNMGRTAFKLAMGSNPECVVYSLGGTDAVQSYRNFYQTKQERFKMDWTKRKVPEWFNYAVV